MLNIKINFRKFVVDRQWFGWYHVGWNVKPGDKTILRLRNSIWYRSENDHWRVIVTANPDPCVLATKTKNRELMRVGVDGLKMGMEIEWDD